MRNRAWPLIFTCSLASTLMYLFDNLSATRLRKSDLYQQHNTTFNIPI
jgi:hypothetical protein